MRKSNVELLLDKVRKNPSPTCRDPRQLELMDYLKQAAFVRLDAVIAAKVRR